MSDTDHPGQPPEDSAGVPASSGAGEPTTPIQPSAADLWEPAAPGPPSWDVVPVPPYAGPQPTEPLPGWSTAGPYPTYPPYPPAPPYGPAASYGPEPAGARRAVAWWTWPLVAVLALVVGAGGGYVGGTIAHHDEDGTTANGGVLSVQRRTAQPLSDDNQSVAKVAEEVLPSTVQIVAEYKGQARGAVGSGFVFDADGHVITNNHVVQDAAADHGPIDVIDQSGNHHKATVVGRSAVYDLAVLDVEGGEKLKPAALGSADQMHVGETAVAFGSPLNLSASVTSGIISAKNRPVTTGNGDDASYINALQTDAAINPGNSGGPLANLQGQVIGVDSALASLGTSVGANDEAGNIGIGFAIPIEQVQVTADQILRTGKAQYPVIGVSVGDTKDDTGAVVKKIEAGTPAARSQLEVDDVITAVDGTRVSGVIDVIVAIRSHQISDTVKLTVRRGGRSLTIPVGLFGKTG